MVLLFHWCNISFCAKDIHI